METKQSKNYGKYAYCNIKNIASLNVGQARCEADHIDLIDILPNNCIRMHSAMGWCHNSCSDAVCMECNMSNENEENLTELMKKYRQIVSELETECHNVNEEIRMWIETRDSLAKPYQDKLTDLEAKIRLPMLDRKASFACEFGKILYRKGAVKRIWNLDALDQICAAKPEIKENIWAFREEKVGDPSITVKVE